MLTERLASLAGKRALTIGKRAHIGGKAYDRYNQDGILIHPYGPHMLHSNSARLYDHLGRFTDWLPYEHRYRLNGRLFRSQS